MTERVSQDVQNRVNLIKQMGGNKKKIDSEAEFLELQKLLSNSEGMSTHEKEHISGLMVEFSSEVIEAQAKRDAEKISDGARKDLKAIKKMAGNRKELNEVEARALLDLIRNTRGDYNAAEIEYFKMELIKAGFGDLLQEIECDNKVKQNNMDIPPEEQVEAASKSELPSETESQPLSQAEIRKANKYGGYVGEAWAGKTDDTEYKFANVLINEHLNSDNFAEFMKGYNNTDAMPYFEQLGAEQEDAVLLSTVYAGNQVARYSAETMLEYLQKHPTDLSENQIKIVEGILAQDNFTGDNAKALDAVIRQIVDY